MSRIIKATGGLEINIDHNAEGVFVCLNGRLDFDSSPCLRDSLLALLEGEHPEALVVDLTETPYIDFSGIATLIEALKIARNHETTLRLKGLHGPLLHLFEVTGLSALFETTGPENHSAVSKVL